MRDFFRGVLVEHVNGLMSRRLRSYVAVKLEQIVQPISKTCFPADVAASGSSTDRSGIQDGKAVEEEIEEKLESLPLVQNGAKGDLPGNWPLATLAVSLLTSRLLASS